VEHDDQRVMAGAGFVSAAGKEATGIAARQPQLAEPL